MDTITLIGICTALALFITATVAIWKKEKLPGSVFILSVGFAVIFCVVTVLRLNTESTTLVAAHALLVIVFIILAKNNLTIAFNHFIKPKLTMKQNTEEQKFEQYANHLDNLQEKVVNGIALSNEEKLLLEYYIEWIRSYKNKKAQAQGVSLAQRR